MGVLKIPHLHHFPFLRILDSNILQLSECEPTSSLFPPTAGRGQAAPVWPRQTSKSSFLKLPVMFLIKLYWCSVGHHSFILMLCICSAAVAWSTHSGPTLPVHRVRVTRPPWANRCPLKPSRPSPREPLMMAGNGKNNHFDIVCTGFYLFLTALIWRKNSSTGE